MCAGGRRGWTDRALRIPCIALHCLLFCCFFHLRALLMMPNSLDLWRFACVLAMCAQASVEAASPDFSGSKSFDVPWFVYAVGGLLWTMVFLGCFCCIRVLKEEYAEMQASKLKKDD